MARSRFTWFGLLLLVLSTACVCSGPQAARPVYYHPDPLIHLRLHADVEFTPLERTLIQQAVTDLAWQTAGYLQVDLEYDLDMYDLSVLERGDFIIRQPEASLLTIMADEKHGGHLLGLTVQEKREVFLIADRLKTPASWRHVVMHELLHAAGADDLCLGDLGLAPGPCRQARAAVMFWSTTGDAPPTCILREDAVEFCRVSMCDPEQLNYCDRT